MARKVLMFLMAAMSVYMTYVVITTSRQSNLFQEWHTLSTIPWMSATIKDFYQNIALLWLWVFYKESSIFVAVLWGIAFVMLGSIATPIYVLIQLWKLKDDEPIERMFARG